MEVLVKSITSNLLSYLTNSERERTKSRAAAESKTLKLHKIKKYQRTNLSSCNYNRLEWFFVKPNEDSTVESFILRNLPNNYSAQCHMKLTTRHSYNTLVKNCVSILETPNKNMKLTKSSRSNRKNQDSGNSALQVVSDIGRISYEASIGSDFNFMKIKLHKMILQQLDKGFSKVDLGSSITDAQLTTEEVKRKIFKEYRKRFQSKEESVDIFTINKDDYVRGLNTAILLLNKLQKMYGQLINANGESVLMKLNRPGINHPCTLLQIIDKLIEFIIQLKIPNTNTREISCGTDRSAIEEETNYLKNDIRSESSMKVNLTRNNCQHSNKCCDIKENNKSEILKIINLAQIVCEPDKKQLRDKCCQGIGTKSQPCFTQTDVQIQENADGDKTKNSEQSVNSKNIQIYCKHQDIKDTSDHKQRVDELLSLLENLKLHSSQTAQAIPDCSNVETQDDKTVTLDNEINKCEENIIPKHMKQLEKKCGNVQKMYKNNKLPRSPKNFNLRNGRKRIEKESKIDVSEEQNEQLLPPPPRMDWKTYHRLNVIHSYLDELEFDHPALCTVSVIGQSHEGKNLKVLKISNGNETNTAVWIDAGMHAREWIGPAVNTYVANYIVKNFKSLPEYITNKDWYFLPVANPDGYEFSHTDHRRWRKNRACINGNHVGVDLNRNFSFGWGCSGSSDSPQHNFYRGPAPFSEPESRAVKDSILYSGITFKVYLTLHSYGQKIVFPFSCTEELCPDYIRLLRGAAIMSKAIYETNGTIYKAGTSRDMMYRASGTSHDWCHGVAHVPFSYLLELCDKNHRHNMPAEDIEAIGKEILNGIFALMHFVDKHPQETNYCSNLMQNSLPFHR